MNPITQFAKDILVTRKNFEDQTDGGRLLNIEAWLALYDGKVDALNDLYHELPELAAYPEIWRLIQTSDPSEWVLTLEKEYEAIRKGLDCACGAKIKWPAKRCEACQKAYIEKRKESLGKRKALKKRIKAQ